MSLSGSLDILLTRKVWRTGERLYWQAQSNVGSKLLRYSGHNLVAQEDHNHKILLAQGIGRKKDKPATTKTKLVSLLWHMSKEELPQGIRFETVSRKLLRV